MKKILFSLCLLFFFSCVSAQINYSQNELQESVIWMYNKGLTKYDTLKNFMPNNQITREEASKFFSLLAMTVYDKQYNPNTNCIFSDINKADITLRQSIIDACKIGIFKGNKGIFNPKEPLTNAQALAVYTRLADNILSENQNPWYKEYYDMILFRGIIDAEGLSIKNRGLADQKATRGEIAIMIYRTSKKKLFDEQQKKVIESGKEQKTMPINKKESEYLILDSNHSMAFLHDFSDVPNISDAQKDVIRKDMDLAKGNAITNLKNKNILDDNDIKRIVNKPIKYFSSNIIDGSLDSRHNIIQLNLATMSQSRIDFWKDFQFSYNINHEDNYYKSSRMQWVIYHEIGHYVDSVKNRGSKDFYKICRNNINIKSECSNSFVTAYSKTNPEEDFSETFAFHFFSQHYKENNDIMKDPFFKLKIDYMNSLIDGKVTIVCVDDSCLNDTKNCYIQDGRGKRYGNATNNLRGECQLVACNPGYIKEGTICIKDIFNCIGGTHYENGQCVPNTRICTVDHGTGRQQWDGGVAGGIPYGSWTPCMYLTCDNGYIQIATNIGLKYEFICIPK